MVYEDDDFILAQKSICNIHSTTCVWDFPCGSVVKNPPAMQETWVQSFDQEDRPPVEKMANNSSVLAWKIPGTQKSGRLQSIESQRVRYD